MFARWLRWQNGTIPQLAQVIYDERELPSGHLDAGKLWKEAASAT